MNEYPLENTHGIEIKHGLDPGWLWPYKHNEKHEVALKSHRRKYRSQYAQDPPKYDAEQMVWLEEDIKSASGKPWESPTRTVVAVDPATTDNKTSDEHGIIAATKHGRDEYTVERDLSRHGKPKHWADTAIFLHDSLYAAAIVIETNQGGDMCEDTLRNAGFKGKIIRVHASKGKVTRAEPISALYSQGFVRHARGLSKLEDEMLDLDPVTGKSQGKSPNRVDALVWALTELSKKGTFMIS
jgi:phage terminase large subunit-like protein